MFSLLLPSIFDVLLSAFLGLYLYSYMAYRFYFFIIKYRVFILNCFLSFNSVQIWNSRTGKCLYVYEEHTEQVNCCQFNNRRGQYLLATCSDDTYIKVSRKDCDKQYGNNQNRVIIVVEIRFKPCKLRFIMSLVEERQKQIRNTDRAEQKECLYLQ